MRAANRPAWPAVMATVMDAQQVVSPVATKRIPGEDNHRSDLVQLGQPDLALARCREQARGHGRTGYRASHSVSSLRWLQS